MPRPNERDRNSSPATIGVRPGGGFILDDSTYDSKDTQRRELAARGSNSSSNTYEDSQLAQMLKNAQLPEAPFTLGSEFENNPPGGGPDVDGVTTVWSENDVWNIKITLRNFSLGEDLVIADNNLVELAINHNITEDSYLKGYATINVKRLGMSLFDPLNSEFIFRGDGKDEIDIEINPQYQKNELPEEIWFTDLKFCVYDVEDLPTDDGHYKRIHFWHKPYFILKTHEAKFSTANYIENTNKPVYLLNNTDRQISTGLAAKHILEEAELAEYIDEDNWDIGSSKTFYTSSPGTTTLDAIKRVLKNHTSETGEHPSIFYYNRGINKFQIIPLPDFFEKAGKDEPGEYQIEHFWINPADVGMDDLKPQPHLAPIIDDPETLDRDIKNQYMSRINETDYTLIDMSGNDSSIALTDRAVHSYDFGKKKFDMFIASNTIEAAKEYFTKTYTEKLFPGEKGAPLFILNKDKKESKVIHHQYFDVTTNSSTSLIAKGRNFLTNAAIFLNLGIEFKVPGSTHRHPGRFVAIEKNTDTANKYDYKLLGQWFVTGTVFSWHRGEMINYITAVKTNTYEDLKFNEDI